jgi:hypothetical protein
MENIKNQIFKRPLTEIIKERISVRSYDPKPLEYNLKKNLSDYLASLNGPFNSKIRLKLIDVKTAMDKDIKLGTYGMVRGASSFVVSAVEKEGMSLEELGYELERFVLYATSLGLGTCWLGGTFKKGEFSKAMELKGSELLPIVTPIGYPNKNKNLLGSLVRMAAGSKNRKPWEEIFFDESFEKKMKKDETSIYTTALEMLRLAPSASNKQPWRIVKHNDTFHFYISHTKNYSKGLDFDMQKIDMGICMCHFDLILKEAGLEGSFKKSIPNIKLPNESIEYIISWVK